MTFASSCYLKDITATPAGWLPQRRGGEIAERGAIFLSLSFMEKGMGQRILRLILILGAMILLVGVGLRQLPPAEERQLALYPIHIATEPEIRVLLDLGSEREWMLSVSGPYRLRLRQRSGRAEEGGGEKPVAIRVIPTEEGVRLGRDEFLEAEIVPLANTTLTLASEPHFLRSSNVVLQHLRGSLRLSRTLVGGKPTLRAIARMGIETYLLGVVPNEMRTDWPLEALRAQAIASRTYALYYTKVRAKKDYDVTSSVMSQVWRPSPVVNPRILMAVNSTRGVVLTENYRLFPSYFHAQCGGETTDARNVFTRVPVTALSGAKCPFCMRRQGPYTWRLALPRDEVTELLRNELGISGCVVGIRLFGENGQPLDTMQRVTRVELSMESGARLVLSAEDFRRALGREKERLASTWFMVEAKGGEWIFTGRGHGHGVGLCQHGAKFLAETEGYSYESILRHYYPGVILVRLW